MNLGMMSSLVPKLSNVNGGNRTLLPANVIRPGSVLLRPSDKGRALNFGADIPSDDSLGSLGSCRRHPGPTYSPDYTPSCPACRADSWRRYELFVGNSTAG
jgi:hypothetical protein